ncbi:hypothetical protein CHH70_15140 [Shouchella clausii]|nr:hypothetical protein CHH70_15140 [Shouchella clausii]
MFVKTNCSIWLISIVALFHTDCGRAFINHKIDEILATFGIAHSLSNIDTPYDNAVAEATFKSRM